MRYTWFDYVPGSMDYVEEWLDEKAVLATGLEEGWKTFDTYWKTEGGCAAGENYWCKIVSRKDGASPFAAVAFSLWEEIVTVMEVLIAPEQRGHGNGTALLRELLDNGSEIFGHEIRRAEAVIFPDNTASRLAFQKAGFFLERIHPDGDALYYAYVKEPSHSDQRRRPGASRPAAPACPLPHYRGERMPNCDRHDGMLPPVKGAACYQVTRANRTHPQWDDGVGGTYKHGADLAWRDGTFYLHYFTNPMSEHTGAGQSILASSKDGMHWDSFETVFPPYRIPACTITDYKGNTTTFSGESYAFIHQRTGFYQTESGRLLLLGFYGWSPDPCTVGWDNYGIGRVVRELYPDDTMGPIFFIRPCWQGGWSREQLLYPLYTEAADQDFIACCRQLLADRLALQQWAEENGDRDELIQIKHGPDGVSNQAFCWYHTDEQTVIGLWKHSRCARSDDGGNTWSPVTVSPSLVMSGQKVWAQKTADGKYAMVYDPTLESTHRWPMCVTTSKDGIAYDDMLLVHGEVPPMRYGGFWKDYGPQYMRGIAEGISRPADAMWIAYTVNKEDVWVARLPLPITGIEPCKTLRDGFAQFNVYSPKWAPVTVTDDPAPALRLCDFDRYDYARAERILCDCARQHLSFTIVPQKTGSAPLYCELQSPDGQTAVRLVFREDGSLCMRTTALVFVCPYRTGQEIRIDIAADCEAYSFILRINDDAPRQARFMTAVRSISRFVLRTGAPRFAPAREDDPIEDTSYILPMADEKDAEAVYDLTSFLAESR